MAGRVGILGELGFSHHAGRGGGAGPQGHRGGVRAYPAHRRPRGPRQRAADVVKVELDLGLRGSGGWQNAYRPRSGYGLELQSNSTTVAVKRNVDGVTSTLRTVEQDT
jgi:hypothetical protein